MELIGMVGVLSAWAIAEFNVAPNREIASITQFVLLELSVDATSQNSRAALVSQLQELPGDTLTTGDISHDAWELPSFRRSWLRGLFDTNVSLRIAGGNLTFLIEMYGLPLEAHRATIEARTNLTYRALTGGRDAPDLVQDWYRHPIHLENVDYTSALQLDHMLSATWSEEYHVPVWSARQDAVRRARTASNWGACCFVLGSLLLIAGKALGWKDGPVRTRIAAASVP
ncbi:MAG: hypothetical protein KC485_13040 [Gemmatimonadetes bacterium]|nr:hypothetical protein [Gemmatimonadota bacterium]